MVLLLAERPEEMKLIEIVPCKAQHQHTGMYVDLYAYTVYANGTTNWPSFLSREEDKRVSDFIKSGDRMNHGKHDCSYLVCKIGDGIYVGDRVFLHHCPHQPAFTTIRALKTPFCLPSPSERVLMDLSRPIVESNGNLSFYLYVEPYDARESFMKTMQYFAEDVEFPQDYLVNDHYSMKFHGPKSFEFWKESLERKMKTPGTKLLVRWFMKPVEGFKMVKYYRGKYTTVDIHRVVHHGEHPVSPVFSEVIKKLSVKDETTVVVIYYYYEDANGVCVWPEFEIHEPCHRVYSTIDHPAFSEIPQIGDVIKEKVFETGEEVVNLYPECVCTMKFL